MEIKDVLKMLEDRIDMLYQIKNELTSKPVDDNYEEDTKELLKLEGKLSELIHLKATIEIIENKDK